MTARDALIKDLKWADKDYSARLVDAYARSAIAEALK